MIQQHLGVWLFDLAHNWRAVRAGWGALNATGGAAAPLFVLLVGVGLTLGEKQSSASLARRGIVLFLFGVLLNLLTPSWLAPFSFYVLHLLGAVLVLGPLLRRLPDAALLASIACVLALSVILRHLLHTPLALTNAQLSDSSEAFGPLRLAFAEGQFPLLPWLGFALVGVWAGRRLQDPSALASAGSLWLALGLLLRAPALLAPAATRKGVLALVTRFSFFPASPVFVCVLLGVTLLLLAAFVLLERRGKFKGLGWLVPLGRASLTLLFVHVLLFREGAARLGVERSLDALPTLGVIALVLGAAAFLTARWSRSGYAYGLEWWLRRAG